MALLLPVSLIFSLQEGSDVHLENAIIVLQVRFQICEQTHHDLDSTQAVASLPNLDLEIVLVV